MAQLRTYLPKTLLSSLTVKVKQNSKLANQNNTHLATIAKKSMGHCKVRCFTEKPYLRCGFCSRHLEIQLCFYSPALELYSLCHLSLVIWRVLHPAQSDCIFVYSAQKLHYSGAQECLSGHSFFVISLRQRWLMPHFYILHLARSLWSFPLP